MKKSSLSSSIESSIQKIGQLSRMQRILISAGTVVLIIGVFVYFFCMPKLQKIDSLQGQIKSLEKALQETKLKASKLEEYREKMEAARAKFTIVSRALPLNNEVPSLLTGISQAGKDSGLSFLLFEPRAEKKQNFYAEIPINMQMSGKYHEVGEFFDRIAGMSRIVNVKHFRLNSGKDAPTKLNIDCTAKTYKFIESSDKDENKK
ncbi:MAG: type 4a pilus biogenesis protein PilO [Desulfosalsimonadaceae bacterium]